MAPRCFNGFEKKEVHIAAAVGGHFVSAQGNQNG
jgi:hypothetical protein